MVQPKDFTKLDVYLLDLRNEMERSYNSLIPKLVNALYEYEDSYGNEEVSEQLLNVSLANDSQLQKEIDNIVALDEYTKQGNTVSDELYVSIQKDIINEGLSLFSVISTILDDLIKDLRDNRSVSLAIDLAEELEEINDELLDIAKQVEYTVDYTK